MRPLHGRRGQNLVEVALVLPIMVIMMLGIVEFGFLYFARGSVDNAAREGARYGSIHPTDTAGIANQVTQTVMGIDTTPSNGFNVEVSYPDGDSQPTSRIRVTVTYPLTTFWPGPGSTTYVTAATMRIETNEEPG